ncbi:hypothetical protein M5362_16585 [Streptomyces sp. Je 1-79]|uniref:hypothetical protein n=1 Tax=Streptomyces sp. Je 1-79 TaxID=2943847 RepID=UPI0021A49618|nr:hypothetical protein [Streptomyces sp. Je 1-79]MCT4354747.1 hypothetical protein [Streptomyces sp. Je 1-79]
MHRVPPRLRLFAALPFLLALALHLTLFGLWGDRLPDPLATHFSTDGRADGWTGLAAFAVVGSGLLLGLGTGWTLLVRRGALWGAWLTAGATGTLLILLVRDNLDASDAARVVSPLTNLAVAAGAGGALALAGWALARLVPQDAPAVPGVLEPSSPMLPLGPGEAAGWSRGTGSRPMTAMGAVLVVAGLLLLLAAPWPVALVLGASGLLVLGLAQARVTVDRRGLTLRPALLPRPRMRIPLDRVESASAREIDALGEFGGWGYRVRAHRSGLVLRSGEALVVRREGGREFAVSVPDAGTAAALLNALVARRESV